MKFVMLALATWRLSYLLVKEEGPGDLALKLRLATGIEYDVTGKTPVSWPPYNPLHCIFCTSLWAAAILYWLPGGLSSVLGASGIVVLAQKLLEAGTEGD